MNKHLTKILELIDKIPDAELISSYQEIKNKLSERAFKKQELLESEVNVFASFRETLSTNQNSNTDGNQNAQ